MKKDEKTLIRDAITEGVQVHQDAPLLLTKSAMVTAACRQSRCIAMLHNHNLSVELAV